MAGDKEVSFFQLPQGSSLLVLDEKKERML